MCIFLFVSVLLVAVILPMSHEYTALIIGSRALRKFPCMFPTHGHQHSPCRVPHPQRLTLRGVGISFTSLVLPDHPLDGSSRLSCRFQSYLLWSSPVKVYGFIGIVFCSVSPLPSRIPILRARSELGTASPSVSLNAHIVSGLFYFPRIPPHATQPPRASSNYDRHILVVDLSQPSLSIKMGTPTLPYLADWGWSATCTTSSLYKSPSRSTSELPSACS